MVLRTDDWSVSGGVLVAGAFMPVVRGGVDVAWVFWEENWRTALSTTLTIYFSLLTAIHTTCNDDY